MREGQPSITANIVACARGAGGVDPFAERLLPSAFSRWARSDGWWTRLVPLVDFLRIRTLTIDAAVETAVRDGSRQLVVLGAGLCARPWRLPDLVGSVVFEVDHPATQKYKRRRLRGLEPQAREVRFVSVDFERDDLTHALADGGQDASAQTTWVWEGVTPYLTPAAIATTLDVIRDRSREGSVLAMTYYTPGPSSGYLLRWSGHMLAALGEPLHGLMSVLAMHELLEAKGFSVTSDVTNRELFERRHGRRSILGVTERVIAERIVVATRRRDA